MDYKNLEKRVEKLENERRPVEYRITLRRHVIGDNGEPEPWRDSTREIYVNI